MLFKNYKLIKFTAFAIVFCAWAVLNFLPANLNAASGFLTLPYKFVPKIMQGWNYSSTTKTHQGIDYYSEVGTELVITADGVAKKYRQSYPPQYSYGNFVIVDHGNGYKSLYAHMNEIDENVDGATSLKRGVLLGTSGITGTTNPHLHFEVLTVADNGSGINRGYGWRFDPYAIFSIAKFYPGNSLYQKLGDGHVWLFDYPTVFITPESTTPTINPGEINSSKISWDKVESDDFEKYEVYRSGEAGGTQNPDKRKLIFSTEDRDVTSYEDKGLRPGTYYYAVNVVYKNGLPGLSEETSYVQANNPIPIETNASLQSNPIIKDGKVYWGDSRYYEPGKYQINYFDLSDMASKSYPISGAGIYAPTEVDANSEFVVFVSSSPATNTDVYSLNIKTGAVNKLNSDKTVYMQNSPSVSENNLAVWSDMRNGSNFDIYYIGLGNTEVGDLRLVAVSGNQRVPKIWGTKVVWNDTRSSNRTDIYYEDILEGGEVLVAQNTGQINPDIWKNYIVWYGKSKIYLYDIEKGEVEPISVVGNITQVRINDGKIVGTNDGGIFVYDIATKKSEKLTFEGFTPAHPYYGNGYIVFEHRPSLSSPNTDIYLIYY